MVSWISLERSKNKKPKANKTEDLTGVKGSVSVSSLILKPLLVYSEQENILADSQPHHLDNHHTPPQPRKIKFGTKLTNLHSNSQQTERMKVIKLMNQTRKPLNSSTDQEMDKSIKYNLVEDVTIKHQANLTKVQSNSDHQELGTAKTLDQLLAGRQIPTSTSVLEQSQPLVTTIHQSPTKSEDKWGDQLLLTFNSVSSGGGGGGGGGGGPVVQGKQSFIVVIVIS